jgi:hypothetical protein
VVAVALGADVELTVETGGIASGLSLNGKVLDHPPTTLYTVSVQPLRAGDNYLNIVLLAGGSPWAYDIKLLADGAVIDEAADQDDGHGSTPSSPIAWKIVAS